MSHNSVKAPFRLGRLSGRALLGLVVGLVALVIIYGLSGRSTPAQAPRDVNATKTAIDVGETFISESDWKGFGTEEVVERKFQETVLTEGKISIDEDQATSIFSPYNGKVLKIFSRAGEKVEAGAPLITIEAADMVQAQNDFVAARSAVETTRAQRLLAEANQKRQADMFAGKATTLREFQEATTAYESAMQAEKTAFGALEAVKNRLKLLGKTEDDIKQFDTVGKFSPEVTIRSPITGIIVNRKVGPGQYVTAGSGDPLMMVDDIDPVWLIAYVRESDSAAIKVGMPVSFRVTSGGNRTYHGKLDFVSTMIDPTTRRLLVRATIPNDDYSLKTEMFAAVRIFIGEEKTSPAIPRASVILEGEAARVWVVTGDRKVASRSIDVGLVQDGWIQVVNGLNAGEKVVTRGTLFIDQMRASATR